MRLSLSSTASAWIFVVLAAATTPARATPTSSSGIVSQPAVLASYLVEDDGDALRSVGPSIGLLEGFSFINIFASDKPLVLDDAPQVADGVVDDLDWRP